MLYREIIAVCSQIHTKHMNTLCGQNVELLCFKPGGTYSDHWGVKGHTCSVFRSLRSRKLFNYNMIKTDSSPSFAT